VPRLRVEKNGSNRCGSTSGGIGAPSLAIVDMPEGGRLLSYQEGTLATVSIVEDGEGVASLHINNRQQEGSSATLLVDAR